MSFSRMNLSDVSQKKIAKHIGSLNKHERERKAKEINEMLMRCKTSEEAEAMIERM